MPSDSKFKVETQMFYNQIEPLLAFMGLGIPELMIIGAIFLLLFGGAKLPGLMRNLGRSVNEFQAGIKEKPADSRVEDSSEN